MNRKQLSVTDKVPNPFNHLKIPLVLSPLNDGAPCPRLISLLEDQFEVRVEIENVEVEVKIYGKIVLMKSWNKITSLDVKAMKS